MCCRFAMIFLRTTLLKKTRLYDDDEGENRDLCFLSFVASSSPIAASPPAIMHAIDSHASNDATIKMSEHVYVFSETPKNSLQDSSKNIISALQPFVRI